MLFFVLSKFYLQIGEYLAVDFIYLWLKVDSLIAYGNCHLHHLPCMLAYLIHSVYKASYIVCV